MNNINMNSAYAILENSSILKELGAFAAVTIAMKFIAGFALLPSIAIAIAGGAFIKWTFADHEDQE